MISDIELLRAIGGGEKLAGAAVVEASGCDGAGTGGSGAEGGRGGKGALGGGDDGIDGDPTRKKRVKTSKLKKILSDFFASYLTNVASVVDLRLVGL